MTFNLSKKLIILTLIISAATLNADDNQKIETTYSKAKIFIKNNKNKVIIGTSAALIAAICGLEIYGVKEINRLSAMPGYQNMKSIRKYADGWFLGAAFLVNKLKYPKLSGNMILAERCFSMAVSKILPTFF